MDPILVISTSTVAFYTYYPQSSSAKLINVIEISISIQPFAKISKTNGAQVIEKIVDILLSYTQHRKHERV